MILTVFDIDGTILDSREVEGVCFANAIERITGKILSTLDWAEYPEPTSSGIVRSLLDGDPTAPQKEVEIKREYCRLLGDARLSHPEEFLAISGVLSFIQRLQLTELGLEHTFSDFRDHEGILEALTRITAEPNNEGCSEAEGLRLHPWLNKPGA